MTQCAGPKVMLETVSHLTISSFAYSQEFDDGA